jgi:predicted dehydrogenase
MAVRASADDRRLRAGVVGAGHMGQYHLLAYAEFWAIELAGVVDIDRERCRPGGRLLRTRALMDHRD